MAIPAANPTSGLRRVILTPVGLLVLALVAMWIVEVADSVLLNDRLQGQGIRPRIVSGLDGVAWAPFLHSDFGHLASNSVPLLALGGLVAARGMQYWARVTAFVFVAGGALTWLLGGAGNHIGASGVLFGYLGAILGAAVFERRPLALAPALLALGFYSSLLVGLVPQDFISWEGHLFGFVAGFVVARTLAEPSEAHTDDPGDVQPWELDEPWLD
ncbi:MAG: rhomboid family intramembrane serine protease [Actinomycetia bacterium]|nr:rhomboid family intramembrane serine protease [Actinomycetes bacterium]